ncbi:MAG: hypothetical protein JWL79_2106 [Frankiales bacterium]|nr:hypothetical protein [Frankiales bacterium]
MAEPSTQPFWLSLATGVAVVWSAVNVRGSVDGTVLAAFYTYLTCAIGVMWWDVGRRGRNPRVMFVIGTALALFPLIGFRSWWRYGIHTPTPRPGTDGFA